MLKRSFDIGPRRRKRSSAPQKSKPAKKQSHPRLATRAPKRKLRDRRREEQVRNLMLVLLGGLLMVGAILYVLWLPSMRISVVTAEGYGNTDALETLASAELKGAYHGIVPRNSFFFYPERSIRAVILENYPAIAAVSVSRTGFSSLSLKASARVSAFWWCGIPENLSARIGNCYEADAEGFIFEKTVDVFAEVATSSEKNQTLHVYADLETASTSDRYPLRSRVQGAKALPDVLKFVRAVQALGIPVASIAIRGDEGDLFVEPSTRITYVIGHEREAEKNVAAALKGLNLVDGSLEYVDLRFDGKVYLKRWSE